MWRTGYTNFFAKRQETGAPCAGEFSGHIFFDDPIIDFDDGVYAGAKLLEALGDGEETIEERLADAPHYWSTSEGRTDVGEEMKFGLINNLKARFEKDYEVIALDGMPVVFPTGWHRLPPPNPPPSLTRPTRCPLCWTSSSNSP